MSAGWHKQRLALIAEKITDGSHNPPKGVPESDYLMLSSKNVFDDDLHYAEPRYLTAEQFQQEDKRTGIIPGDVLLTIVGTVGRCAVVPTNAPRLTLQRSVAVIRPKEQIVEPRFLMYSFIERNAELNKKARGVAQKGIYLGTLRELEVRLPPLPEQHRIVAILDEAFDGIATAKANAEKNIQNARALFESHLQSVFTQRSEGWVEKRLGDIAEVQSGGTPLVSNKSFWGGNIPWYSSGELNDLHTTAPERHITTAGLNGSNTKLFPQGSLLIGMYDTAALKMSILERDAAFNQAIAGVRPNEHVDLIFVLHAINAVKPFILSQRRGVRQKNLSLTKIKEITLSLPPLSEQQAIVSRLDDYATETQRLEAIYQQKLAALDGLKKSLLHHAFSGQF